jgi:hypothetical protein
MYEVDGRDQVIPLPEVPRCDVGAPLPVVLADEYRVLLGYLLSADDPEWDGTSIRIVDHESPGAGVIIEFRDVVSSYFGAPNDEAFQGHPLAERGLRPYSAAKIENSSWIHRLERMNSVHPYHRPDAFWARSHYVFTFHDSTFECVADKLAVHPVPGPMSAIAAEIYRRLFRAAQPPDAQSGH